jgi:hypothetical protein
MALQRNHTAQQHIVLRARLGIDYPDGLQLDTLEDRLATAITDTITALGASMDLLQVGIAARPDWEQFGPVNRISGGPLWDPEPNHDPRTA